MTTLNDININITNNYDTEIVSEITSDDTLKIQLSNDYFVSASFDDNDENVLLYSLNTPEETVEEGYYIDFSVDTLEEGMEEFNKQINAWNK